VKKSKYTEEQIAFALKQAEVGTPVEEVCRKMGISDATFYNWRKKYGGLGPSELRRLKPEISTAERYQNGVSLNTFPRKSA
jgi:putative transposase